MGDTKPGYVRILDGCKNKGSKKVAGVRKESYEDLFDDETEDLRQSVDIGLDISTSIVGLVTLDSTTGDLITMQAIKLNKARFKDTWDKATHTKAVLQQAFDPSKQKIERVFVEASHMKFTPGFSSAKTLFSLATFNGIVSYLSYELFDAKPIMVNVRSARKKLGININYKDKTKSTKTKVFEVVRSLNPDFPWEQHVAKTGHKKGQLVYGNQNYDLADAWIICRGGQLIHPKNPKRR